MKRPNQALEADTPVPDDQILPAAYDFDAPGPQVLEALFARAHARSEASYNGDGSWGTGFVHDASSARWRALFAAPEDFVDRPTVRDTARRLSGYARALDVADTPVYRDRLAAGVEWLLAQQFPDGSFPWWVSRTGMPGTDHLYYVTGNAVVGLLDAWRHVPDPRIPEAVARAARWTARGAASPNNNYNSFACWVLAGWYRHDPQAERLDAAVRLTLEGVLPGQLANGGWAGHNSWVYYQGIIVAGLAVLLPILPAGHGERQRIARCFHQATNNLVARQGADGALLATFDAAERAEAEVRRIGYEKAPTFKADPHALLGLLWAHEHAGAGAETAIRGLVGAYAAAMEEDDPESDAGGHGIDTMALGYAWRWVAQYAGVTRSKDSADHQEAP